MNDLPQITPDSAWQFLLVGHLGQGSGITAAAAVRAFGFAPGDQAAQRQWRQAMEQLRLEGLPICADPLHGYYVAATAAELDGTCAFLLDRAMASLKQIAAMRRVALPDLRGQLGLPLGEPHATEQRDEHDGQPGSH